MAFVTPAELRMANNETSFFEMSPSLRHSNVHSNHQDIDRLREAQIEWRLRFAGARPHQNLHKESASQLYPSLSAYSIASPSSEFSFSSEISKRDQLSGRKHVLASKMFGKWRRGACQHRQLARKALQNEKRQISKALASSNCRTILLQRILAWRFHNAVTQRYRSTGKLIHRRAEV